jgi:hypothetical protein
VLREPARAARRAGATAVKARAGNADERDVDLSLGRHEEERVVYLDEDVYVVIGDPGRAGTERTAWPQGDDYAPIPEGAAIGTLQELLGALGPELWRAKRRGPEARLTGRVDGFGAAAVLLWGADCVEHLARRVNGVDGNVVESIALARRYAHTREFDQADAHRLAAESAQAVRRLRRNGLWAAARGIFSRGGELNIPFGGLLNPSETRYEAEQLATADLRALQVALMHATGALCGAEPLAAGRDAASWCRRASARNALAQEAGDRVNAANEASFLNLLVNPFAQGTLARSLPGQVKAIQDGDVPEAEWQAARLSEHMSPDGANPLPPGA